MINFNSFLEILDALIRENAEAALNKEGQEKKEKDNEREVHVAK